MSDKQTLLKFRYSALDGSGQAVSGVEVAIVIRRGAPRSRSARFPTSGGNRQEEARKH